MRLNCHDTLRNGTDRIVSCYRVPQSRRRGNIAILAAFMMVIMLVCVAFAVDLGYLYLARTEAQACADAAALAAGWEIIGDDRLRGMDDVMRSEARNKAIQYAALNPIAMVNPVLDPNISNDSGGEIVFGRFENPSDPSDPFLLNDPKGPNAVKVRVSRTADQNGAVTLFFAQLLGINSFNITAEATAMFRDNIAGFRPTGDSQTSTLLPFVLKLDDWNTMLANATSDDWSYDPDTDSATRFSDGISEVSMFPDTSNGNGGITPGNFGTIDFSGSNNSASDLNRIIEEGPGSDDFASHGGELMLDPNSGTVEMSGNPGMTTSMMLALDAIVGQPRTILLYDQVVGNGETTVFRIVGFAGIRIMDFRLTGVNDFILIQPAYVADPTAVGGTGNVNYYVSQPIHLAR